MDRAQRLSEPVRPFAAQARVGQEPMPLRMAGVGASLAQKPAHGRRRGQGHKLSLSVESPHGFELTSRPGKIVSRG